MIAYCAGRVWPWATTYPSLDGRGLAQGRAYTCGMQAIVTTIDDPYRDAIENIWGELKAVFGLQGIIGSIHPHVTFHVAESYGDGIEQLLQDMASSASPLMVETHGIGVFRGSEIIVYLHVTNSAALAQLHAGIWEATAAGAVEPVSVYAPATWVPHITLASGEVAEEQLPTILQFLNARRNAWSIPVTNISLVRDTSSSAATWRRFEMQSPEW